MASFKTTRNDITGAFLRTTFNKEEYRTNWEKIFGNKEDIEETAEQEETTEQDDQDQAPNEDQ